MPSGYYGLVDKLDTNSRINVLLDTYMDSGVSIILGGGESGDWLTVSLLLHRMTVHRMTVM